MVILNFLKFKSIASIFILSKTKRAVTQYNE